MLHWFKRRLTKTDPPAAMTTDAPALAKADAPAAVATDAPIPTAPVAAPSAPSVPTVTSSPPAPPAPRVLDIPRDKIASRAAEIWVRKGRPHGQDLQNWMEAEAELRAEFAANPDPEPLPRKSR